MKHVGVIGGGIIGLSTAYYLTEAGYEVTLFDSGDLTDNCSYGNAGYICPSHFVPLASPGIISQGLKWMLNSKSPFYIKPRLDRGLISWGLQFMKHANAKHVKQSAQPLLQIAHMSQQLYEEWFRLPGIDAGYQKKGLLELFQTKEKEKHAHHTCSDAMALGLEALVLDADEVKAMEPQVKMDIRGALFFPGDAHLQPHTLMRYLVKYLETYKVKIRRNTPVTGIETKGRMVTGLIAGEEISAVDGVVLAAGSWSKKLAGMLKVNLPLVGGRGYSFSIPAESLPINTPAVLMEGRVALTPFAEGRVRIGGTMEITSLKAPPNFERVQGIVNAVNGYYPSAGIIMPATTDIWYGYRPCSADGLPFIGKAPAYENAVIATGHAMVGMSLGAATGKLATELITGAKTSMPTDAFGVERFG